MEIGRVVFIWGMVSLAAVYTGLMVLLVIGARDGVARGKRARPEGRN